MTTFMPVMNDKTENEKYLESPEWKALLEQAKTAENKSYTVVYRSNNGELSEAWHYLSDFDIDYVKKKYEKQGKEIVRFLEKELSVGAYLNTISGERND